MPKSLSTLLISSALLVATLYTVTGQSPAVTLAPFLIDLHQQIPATVTLTLDDGITTTVPLTLTVNLQLAVTGPTSATITTATPLTPSSTISPISPIRPITTTDALGYPYQLTAIDDHLTLTEWTAYQDGNDQFTIAGEIQNTSTDQRFSLADIVVRFYRADDTLLAVETYTASGHWVDPDQTIRFAGFTYTAPDQIDHYTIEITGQDWTPVP